MTNDVARWTLLSIALLAPAPWYARAAAGSAAADLTDLSLEELMQVEVVVGASRFEQSVLDAPASVSIVSAAEIRRFGYRTIGDVLRAVRGVHVTYDRNYTYVGVRGFQRPGDYNTRVLLLVDGHRLNENVYGGAYVGTEETLDVELLDRVEVIRGPSSSLYGTSAFLAVVNLVTRVPGTSSATEVWAGGASYSTGLIRAEHETTSHGGAGLLLSGSWYDSGGHRLFYEEFDDPATDDGLVDNDHDRYGRFFASLTRGGLAVRASHASRVKGYPTASFGTIFDHPRAETFDAHSYLDVAYDHAFSSHARLTTRAFYDRYYYRGVYPFDYPPETIYADPSTGEWVGGEVVFRPQPLGPHRLTLGGEYRLDLRQRIRGYDESPYFLYTDFDRRSAQGGVFAEDLLELHPRLQVQVGVRADHDQAFGWTGNPRVGLLYKPADRTSVKLIYGEAFRAPTAYELYYADSGFTFKPSLTLDPETIATTEVAVESYLGRGWRLAGSAYRYRMKDLISLTTDPADGLLVFRNLDRIGAAGVEVEVEKRWPGEAGVRFSHAYAGVRDEATRRRPANAPRHLAKLNLWGPAPGGWLSGGLEVQFTGDRRTPRGTVDPSSLLVNLTLTSRDLPGDCRIVAGVSNLLDTEYGDPGSEEHRQEVIYQDGWTYRLLLVKSF